MKLGKIKSLKKTKLRFRDIPVQVERRGIGWTVAARARLESEVEEEEIQRHVSRMRMRNEGEEDTLVNE